jgi:hypothetical protein
MPTTRIPLRRAAGRPGLLAIQRALVYDAPLPEPSDLVERAQIWAWSRDAAAWRGVLPGAELWAQRRDEVLAYWVEAHAGSRPSGWWRWEAPGPRQQVGGIGRPWGFEQLTRGVPMIWNYGPWRDMWASPPPPIDPKNPPTFESEATFLDRHGLLLPGERDRLQDDDFAPVSIFDVIGLDDGGAR